MYMSNLRHIYDPVLLSLKMKGIRFFRFLYTNSLYVSCFINHLRCMHFILTTGRCLIWKNLEADAVWLLALHSYFAQIHSLALNFKHARRLSVGTVSNHGKNKETTVCGPQWLSYGLRRNPCRVSHGFRFHWSSGQQVVCRRSVSINLMNSHSELLSGDRAPWPKLSKRNLPDFCYILMACVTVRPTGVVGLPAHGGNHNHGKSQLCMKPFPLFLHSYSGFQPETFSRLLSVCWRSLYVKYIWLSVGTHDYGRVEIKLTVCRTWPALNLTCVSLKTVF
jgi:hypothetical protein